jgi:PEP-CTERM motif
MKLFRVGILSVAVLLTYAISASASSFPISFTTFGTLAGATFGGSGIPINAVAITTIQNGNDTITLGLTAHGRYDNPAVTNNGAGTFFAGAGQNDGLQAIPHSQGATWNFAYYVSIVGGGTFNNYELDLLYEFDPAANTDSSLFGRIDLDDFTPAATLLQGSENLLFGFLAVPFPGILIPPAGVFNPNAAGQYTFVLRATALTGAPLGTAAINVEVAPMPEPGTLALFGVGSALLARRRLKRRA